MVRATTRRRKAERIKKEDKSLHATGIRKLRRQTVFTTPNVFPPEGFAQQDVDAEPEFREASSRRIVTSASRSSRRSTISTTSFARRARS